MVARPMDFMESGKLKLQQASGILLLKRHRPRAEGQQGHQRDPCHCHQPIIPPGSVTVVMLYAVYPGGHAGPHLQSIADQG